MKESTYIRKQAPGSKRLKVVKDGATESKKKFDANYDGIFRKDKNG